MKSFEKCLLKKYLEEWKEVSQGLGDISMCTPRQKKPQLQKPSVRSLAGKFKNHNVAIVVGTEQKNIRKSHYKVEC